MIHDSVYCLYHVTPTCSVIHTVRRAGGFRVVTEDRTIEGPGLLTPAQNAMRQGSSVSGWGEGRVSRYPADLKAGHRKSDHYFHFLYLANYCWRKIHNCVFQRRGKCLASVMTNGCIVDRISGLFDNRISGGSLTGMLRPGCLGVQVSVCQQDHAWGQILDHSLHILMTKEVITN